jgi:hypothetical protein
VLCGYYFGLLGNTVHCVLCRVVDPDSMTLWIWIRNPDPDPWARKMTKKALFLNFLNIFIAIR